MMIQSPKWLLLFGRLQAKRPPGLPRNVRIECLSSGRLHNTTGLKFPPLSKHHKTTRDIPDITSQLRISACLGQGHLIVTQWSSRSILDVAQHCPPVRIAVGHEHSALFACPGVLSSGSGALARCLHVSI
jgi:hypothetical protein